ncbi:hypothetical protein MYX07_02675 [Patescibacteria group bacterium AH-259-L07]|nr:hypothetical protein [Patescibacteria group bacterium AH-259-L07]
MKRWPWLGYFFVFALGFIIFIYILIPPGIIGPDSFYHTKMALMIKEQGLIKSFPWTQFTTYKNLFVDHHFGYHYLLIPFLSLPSPQNLDPLSLEIDQLIKAKLGTAFFAALVFVMIYWFLKRFKIKSALLWTLLAYLLAPFLLRLSLTRAPAISLIILILGFYFIIKKKYMLLFLLSFIYVWTYGAWPLMLVTVIIYALASAAQKWMDQKQDVKNQISKIKNRNQKLKIKNTNKIYKNIFTFLRFYLLSFIFNLLSLIRHFFIKTNVKLLASCITGLLAGLIINPYFPKTLPFYWFQTIKIAIINYSNKIGVGAEWYPFDPSLLIIALLPLLIFWVIAMAWFITNIKKQNTTTWFFTLLSVFFLLYSYKAQRNIEYFIPPALFLSTFTFGQMRTYINWATIGKNLKKYYTGSDNIFYFLCFIFFIVFIGFFIIFYLNFSIVRLHTQYKEKRPINQFQMAAHWLKNNTQKGEIIFQSDWDIFPQLFYFNAHNYYINGLDQTFMYEYDKELYTAWHNIVSGKTSPQDIPQTISEKFNASYVFIDKKQDKIFYNVLKKSPQFKKTYEDYESIIYKIP